MSTTTSTRVSRQEFSSPVSLSTATIVMTVPAGTRAIDIGHGRNESEILLQRGTRWRITGDTGPGVRGRVIHMEMIEE